MRITRIVVWQVPLTSRVPYHMAGGKTCDAVTSILLRVDTDESISGWGEVCPIPHYLPAYAEGVRPALEYLAPEIIGADPIGPEALMGRIDSWLQGHVYAKSALDLALWDITGKVAKLPLYKLLGGRQMARIPVYHSITCIAPHEMAVIAREAQAEGLAQFQVKLGADNNWEADVARLRLVREAVGKGPLVYGDWNCGASRLDATRVGKYVAAYDIMLEQPCATLEECAAVRVATGLPMKIDENAHDTASLLRAYELGCMDAVALKLSKSGGLSAIRRLRDLCLHLGPRMCIEDTWGTDVTTGAFLHLAASTPQNRIMNTCDLSGYVAPRLDPYAPSRSSGHIAPPEGPGIGINPDSGVLGQPVAIID
ncbi:enolase C-terminal domain-like protein [Mesorhizobium ciceri]|uniref:mandelate racemase/muconate lactonizing enzyme family protein n=1 Tax=Mesorhizobium TaxID=68287 RepID=UPI0007A93AB1|nr:enolase C-terminal domain-like protein [Mesorhizobium ciceri]AMX98942.1 mandelate racemase [Mesorhizobium ciceri biovar biserrulae]